MYLLATARFKQSATLFLLYVMRWCSYLRPVIHSVFVSVIMMTGWDETMLSENDYRPDNINRL